MKKAFYNASIFTGKEFTGGKAILVDAGKITGLVSSAEIPSSYEAENLGGNNIAPSFIDLQIYGGNGMFFAYHLSAASLEATYEYCKAGGCLHFLITVATNSDAVIFKAIEVVKDYWQQGGKGLLGLHLEGPYINPVKRGAHLEKYIKKPTEQEIKKLLDAGRGIIKMITLAPEMCDEKIICMLREDNIVVSAGHSNATYAEAMKAFNAGIPAATHLFNAMSPLQSREPGMAGAVYDNENVMSSIVADGVHVHYASVRISHKLMGGRLFLITDAVTGITEGPYHHVFKGDRYTLPDGTLSGSSLTMMKAVKNCVLHASIHLSDALRMATINPAKVIGMSDRLGKIAPGYNASFVVFDDGLNMVKTIG